MVSFGGFIPVSSTILRVPLLQYVEAQPFLVWKRVHSDKKCNMKLGTHKAYVSFCFNGLFRHSRLCANQYRLSVRCAFSLWFGAVCTGFDGVCRG